MRTIKSVIGLLALVLVGTPLGRAQDPAKDAGKMPTAAQLKIATAISKGHAYQKHVIDEKLFPEVKSRAEFATLIAKTLANPTSAKELNSDREAFYDRQNNTIVIVNHRARDKGTCFRPSAGKRYYDNLK